MTNDIGRGTRMKVYSSLGELTAAIGSELGHSDWLQVTQDRIDKFAEATGDHQWIHVDPERAATGPFGHTIAHGWLTASVLPVLTQQIYRVDAKMGINYGLNKLRFPSPVPVDSEIRASSVFLAITEIGSAVQLEVSTSIHVRGSDKPALVAETVSRYYW